MRRLALISGVAVAILGVAAVPASAKAPSGGSTTPATLVVNNDPVGGTVNAVGGTVATTATGGPSTVIPWQSVVCTSNGVQVYMYAQHGTEGATAWTADWTMSSVAWQDAGNAPGTCVAELYYFTYQGRAETGFVVMATANFAVG